MSVRICALSVPQFYDGGIEVGIGWSAMPAPDEITDEQRAVLLERVGSLIQIHPDDVGGLAEHGLELVGGKLCEAGSGAGDKPAKRTKKNKGADGAGKD